MQNIRTQRSRLLLRNCYKQQAIFFAQGRRVLFFRFKDPLTLSAALLCQMMEFKVKPLKAWI